MIQNCAIATMKYSVEQRALLKSFWNSGIHPFSDPWTGILASQNCIIAPIRD